MHNLRPAFLGGLLFLLASCAPPPGPAPNNSAVVAQMTPPPAAAPARPVPSEFTQSVLRDAAANPLAALPERVPVPSRANGFNAGVLKRALLLMGGGEKTYTGIGQGEARYYNYLDWYLAASLASFGLTAEAKAFIKTPSEKESLAELCVRPRNPSTTSVNCTNKADEYLAAALTLQNAGNTAEAEKYYQRAMAAEPMITAWMRNAANCTVDTREFRGNADDFRHDCSAFFAYRTLYEGIAGRPQAMVQSMLASEATVGRIRSIDDFPMILHYDELADQWRLRGQLRMLATAASLIYDAAPKLEYIDTTSALFNAIDVQTNAANGLPSALNLLAVAARAPSVYLAPGPNFRANIGLALDCRAVAIAAHTPQRRAAAVAEFDALLSRYLSEGETYNTGACLYQLAPVVGHAEAQPRIYAVLKAAREKNAAPIAARVRQDHDDELKVYKDFINPAEHYNDEHMTALELYISALQKSAGPWVLYSLDDSEYRRVILEILDASRKLHMQELYISVARMAIFVESHTAH